ncbi:MAG: hypothetical protein A2W20_08885, partial [Candidatus Aminicenantes bacterium RBG_16_66_30]
MEGLSRRRTALLAVAGAGLLALAACGAGPHVTYAQDDAAGALAVHIGGREAFVFQYGPEVDLPHYWPMRSPSGKNMLVRKTEPYPHHRSFWFADTVRPEGGERDLSFYNSLNSGTKTEAGDHVPPFRDRIRLVSLPRIEAKNDRAEIVAELVWETDGQPVINERRELAVHSLGGGEYLLDLTWTLTVPAGDVQFVSDDVHYAWPFLRLDTAWNGEHGGRITSDSGATGQGATNMKPALWIDYSNTVEGVAEGVAIFQWPDGQEHRWLTREYGCFGPRRPDDRSGKPFTLRRDESLTQRAGVLVH